MIKRSVGAWAVALFLGGCSGSVPGTASGLEPAALADAASPGVDGGSGEGAVDGAPPGVDASDGGADAQPEPDAADPDAGTGEAGQGTDGGICEAPAPGDPANDCGYASNAPIDCSTGAACGRTTAYRCMSDAGAPRPGACAAVGVPEAGTPGEFVDYCCAGTACARAAGEDHVCGTKGGGTPVGYWCPGAAPTPPFGACKVLVAQAGATFYCCPG